MKFKSIWAARTRRKKEVEDAVLVFANGSQIFRSGFAGEAAPRVTFGSAVGYPRFPKVMPDGLKVKGVFKYYLTWSGWGYWAFSLSQGLRVK